ncbi:TetR/AcrR family transcriptional regulator [Lentzea sp. NPDC058436]|uniref:TetR/AcrR family transcriptional regulator n=1 Tax=Lentzea sp. NPDC058436 TaxID=3346499 RepID=UPI00364D8DC7
MTPERISTRRQKRDLVIPKPPRNGNIKVTREGWVNSARVALIEDGIDGVKVDRLARRANVTRGGFYHHFKSHQEVLDALLDNWRTTNRFTPAEVDVSNAVAANAALDHIVDDLLHETSFDPQFDMAVREWARISQPVADVVHEVDEQRITVLSRIFKGMGHPPKEALIRARVFYWHQIGYYAVGVQETLAEREGNVSAYVKVLAGERYSGKFSKRRT